MPSLNVDINYFDHPKTKRLVALVGPRGDVFPLRMWSHAGKFFRKDGILRNHTTHELESLLGWDGQPGNLESALIKVGFGERQKEHFKINDWKEHEGHLQAYHKRAKQAAKSRWGEPCLKDATSNGEAMPLQCSTLQSSSLHSKEEKKTSSAKAASPFWHNLIDHIDLRWTWKKKGARYLWSGKDFAALKRVLTIYQPWDVMALYDVFIQSSDDFAIRQGFSVTEFVRQLPVLVDGLWKAAAEKYHTQLEGPIPGDINKLVASIPVKEISKGAL